MLGVPNKKYKNADSPEQRAGGSGTEDGPDSPTSCWTWGPSPGHRAHTNLPGHCLDKFLRKTAQSMEWNASHCQQVPPQLPEEVQRFIQGAQMCSRAADRVVFSQLPVPANGPS